LCSITALKATAGDVSDRSLRTADGIETKCGGHQKKKGESKGGWGEEKKGKRGGAKAENCFA